MKKLLFLLAGVMFLVQTNNAQMQPPPLKLQASVVPSMMNSLSVLLVWPDVNLAIYPAPEKFNVYKKNAGITDSGKFELVWMTREGKFMDHKVELGKKYSYYVVTKYHNQPDIVSDTVEVLVSEANNVVAKISGTVFDEATSVLLRKARIEFFPASPMTGRPPSYVVTDSAGLFSVKLQAGDYFMFTVAEGYTPEFYDNAQFMNQATKITLKSGDSLEFKIGLKQFVKPNLFSISGTVKDEAGNPQKAIVTAVVNNRNFNHAPEPGGHCFSYKTDELGNFKVFGRENDTVVIFVDPLDRTFLKQFYNNQSTFETAEKLVVTQDLTGIDVTLKTKTVYANGVSGVVVDSSTTLPIMAKVYAYQKKMNNHKGSRNFVLSDSLTGAYSLSNLEPGTYYLLAAARGYRPTFFKYDGTQTHNWRNADSIVVTETGIISNVNFGLSKIDTSGSSIVFGTIYDNEGQSVEGVVTSLLNEGGKVLSSTISDVDGSFILEGLSSGSYQLITSAVDFNVASTSDVTLESSNNYISLNVVLTADGVTAIESEKNVVTTYALNQNYPNPFNPTTIISYQLPANGFVSIKIYNVIGKEIATLVNEFQQSGTYAKEFSADGLTSGVYFYTIKSGNYVATKKMILIK